MSFFSGFVSNFKAKFYEQLSGSGGVTPPPVNTSSWADNKVWDNNLKNTWKDPYKVQNGVEAP